MLALWRVMNCSVSGKKGKKRREKTIKINLSQNAGCTDVDTVTNYRAESVYQCCCLCSQEHTGLVVVVYICVRIVLLNKSVDTVHAVHTYRSTYIVCVCVCGLLTARCSAIINKASQLSRQHCSLTACLQTLDHLVLLFTSGLVPQRSATASLSLYVCSLSVRVFVS